MGRKAALTDEQVAQVRARNEESAKVLATEFGVTYQTILKVRKGAHPYEFPEYPQGELQFDSHGNEVQQVS